MERLECALGWPLPSLRYAWSRHHPHGVAEVDQQVLGGVSVGPFGKPPRQIGRRSGLPDGLPDDRLALPLTPNWPGLVGSTAFWFLAWLAAMGLGYVVADRRLRRRRRGNRCARCGYALEGLTSPRCPECGLLLARTIGKYHGSRPRLATALAGLVIVADLAWATVLTRRFEGPGPLHVAACRNDPAAIRQALAAGADADEPYDHFARSLFWQSTPLDCAIAHGHVEAMRILIEAGADLGERNLWTPMLTAVFWGEKATVQALLDAGLGVNQANSVGLAPLPLALHAGHDDLVALLLEHKADAGPVNLPAVIGLVGEGTLEAGTVHRLVDAGADVTFASWQGTPLYQAIREGRIDLAWYLLEHGVDPATDAGDNVTAAIAQGQPDLAAWLLAEGADPNRGEPLVAALRQADLAMARRLLEAGADPGGHRYAPNVIHAIDWERTPDDLVHALFRACGDVNAVTGKTGALHRAVYWSDVNAVEWLLRYGADPEIADGNGLSALELSRRRAEWANDADLAILLMLEAADEAAQAAVPEPRR